MRLGRNFSRLLKGDLFLLSSIGAETSVSFPVYITACNFINFFDRSLCSPPSPREFEFQMSSNILAKDSTTSPADELFYQGKLLPLHLPPRFQMVEKILQSSSISLYDYRKDASDDIFSTPLATAINTPTAASTPFESCNISPSESFRREVDQEDYLFEYVNAMSDFVAEDTKKSVARQTKHSLLGLKLKASKAFLKSLFSKSGCSHDLSFGQIQKENRCQTSRKVTGSFGGEKDRRIVSRHRRSISGAIKHHLTAKPTSSSSISSASSSSSSSSSDSLGFQELLITLLTNAIYPFWQN